jgi:hypothetical protein
VTQIARHVAAAVAALALTALVAGCSSQDSGDGSTATASTPMGSEHTPVADTPDVAAPTAAALPASDFAEGSGYSFATPSKRIQCRAIDSSFVCQTEGDPHTVTTSDLCGFYPGYESRAVRFGFFDGSSQPCATIIQGEGFDSPHTLSYGQSVAFQLPTMRTVTCASAVEGLTCTQVGGPGAMGFFLSIDSFTVL